MKKYILYLLVVFVFPSIGLVQELPPNTITTRPVWSDIIGKPDASTMVGPSGQAGAQGAQGIQGPAGADGAVGSKGDKGDPGNAGSQGIQGIQGPAGADGVTGPQGIQGIKGDTGNTGAQGAQGATGATGAQGAAGVSNYTINVQALTSSPADATTYYFGMLPKAPTTSAGISKIYIRKAGTIKVAEIYTYSGTAGTNESWSFYIRLNNTTDTLIATVGTSASERVFSNTGLSIAVSVGDYIEIKTVCPTWATNPLTSIWGGYIYVE